MLPGVASEFAEPVLIHDEGQLGRLGDASRRHGDRDLPGEVDVPVDVRRREGGGNVNSGVVGDDVGRTVEDRGPFTPVTYWRTGTETELGPGYCLTVMVAPTSRPPS